MRLPPSLPCVQRRAQVRAGRAPSNTCPSLHECLLHYYAVHTFSIPSPLKCGSRSKAMARPTSQAFINTTHRYDIANPDAVIQLSSTTQAKRKLLIWNARGARRKFRLAETIQENGEPEYPHGHALYLDVDRDPVIPMYAIVQYQPSEWHIEVRHDAGGEPVVYPFKTKTGALNFQALVTGYDVDLAACFEEVHVAVVHVSDETSPKLLRKLKPMAELEDMAQVQLWQRRPPLSGVGSPSRQSVASDPRRASTFRTVTSARDAVSLQTDPITKQDVYISEALPPPVLVAFMLSRDGRATMLKINSK